MNRNKMRAGLLALALMLATFLTGCMSTDYDLAGVGVPVWAGAGHSTEAGVKHFQIEEKQVQWVFGLFGESKPEVGKIVANHAGSASGVVNFRVTHDVGLLDFWVTHLSLSLVRMRTVVIEGDLLGGAN